MKLPDPFYLRTQEPKNLIQFAAGQLQGERSRQEDYFLNFNDECFAVADGVGSLPNGDIAAKLAAETAVWAYKLVRQRRYYWAEKKKLLARIFRTSNLTLWQKQKETGFGNGLASTLSVLLAGPKNFWVGHAGDSSVWLFRNADLTKLTTDHVNSRGELTKALGTVRLGVRPQIISREFHTGDILLLLTDGITRALSVDTLGQLCATFAVTRESPVDFISKLLRSAEKTDPGDNMTAVVIRRLG